MALGYELFRLDGRAFLEQFAGVRRHRTGQDAADIGVVSPRGDVEDDVLAVESRGDDCDVR